MYKEIYYNKWYNFACEEVYIRRDGIWKDYVMRETHENQKRFMADLIDIDLHISRRFKRFIRAI